MEKIDYGKAIEIAPDVFWVGYNFKDLWCHTNAYLVVEGKEAALIDPGSSVDFKKVLPKIKSICRPGDIKHIILHHQDPDLCSSTTQFEKLSNLTVYMPERAILFAKFYGIKSLIIPISMDNETIEFKTGRKLRFLLTPYCHAPGAMVTYDEKSKALFSSDIFGAFNKDWELYSDMIGYERHLKTIKMFMEPYMPSREAIMNFVKKIEKLDIKLICPQHGSILRKDIKSWIGELKKMKYARAIGEKKTGLEFDVTAK